MMKSVLRKTALPQAAAIALLLAATAAGAADLPGRFGALPASVPEPAAYSWTGAFAGVQAGYAWGDDRAKEFLTQTGQWTGLQFPYKTSGGLAGIHAGANYQISSLVFGVIGDLEYSGLKGGFRDNPGPGNPGGVSNVTVRGQGSLRGRVGYAYDRLLVYGTGGLALANLKYLYLNPSSGLGETTSSYHTGWTAGGGVEYAFTDHFLGHIEYRYTNLGSFRYDSKVAYPGFLTGEQRPRFSTARVGASYKF